MMYIRPVSDLRNKYTEIENLVLKEDEAVYLTKNGYGSMVVMSLEKYSSLVENIELDKLLQEKYKEESIEKILDEIDEEINDSSVKYYTHEEIFSKIRRKLNDK